MPIGISFFTFQALSYVIDVYRGTTKAQKNFGKVLLYVSFFPQLIAGPIVKYHDIEVEVNTRTQTLEGTFTGIRRFAAGLCKKVLIANTMGLVADNLFGAAASQINILGAWAGAISYMLQIYFDFSGYSDMAIGLGMDVWFSFPGELQLSLYYQQALKSSGEDGIFLFPDGSRNICTYPLAATVRVAPGQ